MRTVIVSGKLATWLWPILRYNSGKCLEVLEESQNSFRIAGLLAEIRNGYLQNTKRYPATSGVMEFPMDIRRHFLASYEMRLRWCSCCELENIGDEVVILVIEKLLASY